MIPEAPVEQEPDSDWTSDKILRSSRKTHSALATGFVCGPPEVKPCRAVLEGFLTIGSSTTLCSPTKD